MIQVNKTHSDNLVVGEAIGEFANALNDKLDNDLTLATGLSPSACSAIIQIGYEPHLPIERLRKLLELQHSSVVRLIDRLEAQGIVLREKGRIKDLRQVSLSLSHIGEKYFTKISDTRKQILDTVISDFTEDEKETLSHFMLRLKLPIMTRAKKMQIHHNI